MAFGVKMVKLKLSGQYDIDGLFEKIKDVDFGEAGVPQVGKSSPLFKENNVIYFPKIDRNNQVWITQNKKGVFTVQRSTIIVGVKEAVKNMAKDDLLNAVTFGFAGMHSVLGGPEKQCEKAVDHVAEVIDGMGL
ncbi:MAG: hypothetical protein VZR02_02135 [Lachnospiraceae bacterium]|nr:hypothetical protein [Lachnospiraceae bacterium]